MLTNIINENICDFLRFSYFQIGNEFVAKSFMYFCEKSYANKFNKLFLQIRPLCCKSKKRVFPKTFLKFQFWTFLKCPIFILRNKFIKSLLLKIFMYINIYKLTT